ncbi:flavodoxin family protein [Anaerorhabdus sp.]|uniref:flavodoxin family protein n=1 Tax=Anaerorhabdus sp. TaxID=1872524 RepID=UPI002FCB4C81
MKKSVLILLGSPRKNGNSEQLSYAFAQGAQSVGHTTETIYIQEKNIKPCLACYGCRKTHKCVQKDEMDEILNKMIQADVIVLATPVYFYSMSAQMKTLIDRTLPRYTEISDKDFYFIATAADERDLMERTMDSLRGFTDCLPNSKIMNSIYGSGLYEKDDAKHSSQLQEAYKMGVEI